MVGVLQHDPQADRGFQQRQGMIRRHHRMDHLPRGAQDLHLGQADGFEDQRDVGGMIDQRRFGRRPVAHPDREGDAGVFAPVAADFFRREEGQEPQRGGDGDLAAPLAGQVGDLALQHFQVGGLVAQVVDKHFPGGGQPDPARQAFEDRHAPFILQRQDPAVQLGRSQGHSLGRLADRPRACHRVDELQWGQPEDRIPTAAGFAAHGCKGIRRQQHWKQVKVASTGRAAPQQTATDKETAMPNLPMPTRRRREGDLGRDGRRGRERPRDDRPAEDHGIHDQPGRRDAPVPHAVRLF
jgi:hypothetical protein